MKTMKSKVLAAVAAIALVVVACGFAVNVNGAIINALTGFQFTGAAPANHTLCGNGTYYVDASACGVSAFIPSQHLYGTGSGCRVLNFGGTCQNTTGNALTLALTVNTGAGPAAGTSVILDGATTSTTEIAACSPNALSSGAVSCSTTVIIPAGYYYNVTTSGTEIQEDWTEWTTP